MSSRARSQSPRDSLDDFIDYYIHTIREHVNSHWDNSEIHWWLTMKSDIKIPPITFKSKDVRTTSRRIHAIMTKACTTPQQPTHTLDSNLPCEEGGNSTAHQRSRRLDSNAPHEDQTSASSKKGAAITQAFNNTQAKCHGARRGLCRVQRTTSNFKMTFSFMTSSSL
jgi:hypothetical protein